MLSHSLPKEWAVMAHNRLSIVLGVACALLPARTAEAAGRLAAVARDAGR
jgi:hypothetical protein